jgi:hypothetical protein
MVMHFDPILNMDIDYNQIIGRDQLDLDKYKEKFAKIAKWLKSDRSDSIEYGKLMMDPTCFSYLHQRVDGKSLKYYPYQDAIANDTHRFKFFRAANQIGKAEYVENIVPTPRGFFKIKELEAGDEVYGRDGQPCTITGIPFEGDRPCYKITFDDGSEVTVAKEHLWICKTEKERFRRFHRHNRGSKKGQSYENPDFNKWVVRSTEEILESGKYDPKSISRKKVSTPVCQPVQKVEECFGISPYILGALIGDGCLTKRNVCFTSGDEEMIWRVSDELSSGKPRVKENHFVVGIYGEDSKILDQLGLIGKYSHTKFIPRRYMNGSIEQRKDLLKGLMDTDGTVYGEHSTLEFCTVSDRLRDDFVELVNSLGGVVNKLTTKKPFYTSNSKRVYCREAYSIRFRISENPFWLERKRVKFKEVKKYRKERIIESIEYVGKLPTKCISVDSEDKSYLTSRNYIVTHNSLLLDSGAARNLVLDHGHGHNEAIVSKSLPQSTFQMRRIKSLLRTMPEIQWDAVKGESDSLSVISVDIKDSSGNTKYTNYAICAPSTEGLLGYDLHKLNLDEFEFWDTDQKYFFNQIAQPRTYSTKGDITIFSNPNGMDNFGAELESQVLRDGKTKKWHVYVFNYLDKPENTQDEYDELQHELSRQEFESTVAALRSISDRNLFSHDEISDSKDSSLREMDLVSKQPFFFLDVAAKLDQCCLVGGWIEPDKNNDKFKHIHIPIVKLYPQGYPLSMAVGSEVPTDGGWSVEKSVKDYLKEWTVNGVQPSFGVDVTGNSGISPLFQAIGVYPTDIHFSGPSKSGFYQKFKYYMEKRLIHRVQHKQWESQASNVVATKSTSGYWLINAASHTKTGGKELDSKLKRIPDDCMDATAGLIFLADNHTIITPSLTII